jgi:hypothetical protein
VTADMVMAQLAGRDSLRDIVENMSAQAHQLHHLDITKLTQFNLSRIYVSFLCCLDGTLSNTNTSKSSSYQ